MPWTTAARVADLGDRDVLGVVCEGVPIVLCRWNGTVSALVDRCPHQGVKLSSGCLVEGFIECPQHFGLFDVRTGASGGGVTMHAAKTVPARMVGDLIEVDLEQVR